MFDHLLLKSSVKVPNLLHSISFTKVVISLVFFSAIWKLFAYIIRFLRELRDLKISSDYTSCDPSMLSAWLQEVGEDMSQYTYQMLNQGVDRPLLRSLTDSMLVNDCRIANGIHRMKILAKIEGR